MEWADGTTNTQPRRQPARQLERQLSAARHAQRRAAGYFQPPGRQLALLHWSPHGAWLRQGSEETASDSLPALIERSLGTAVPIEAFFAWLQGRPLQAQGWHADLGQHAQGRISARRTDPLPQAQLKIILQSAP